MYLTPQMAFNEYVELQINFLRSKIENIIKMNHFIETECKANFNSDIQNIIDEYIKYENYKYKESLELTRNGRYNYLCYYLTSVNDNINYNNYMVVNNTVNSLEKLISIPFIFLDGNIILKNIMPIKTKWNGLCRGDINNLIDMINNTINNIIIFANMVAK